MPLPGQAMCISASSVRTSIGIEHEWFVTYLQKEKQECGFTTSTMETQRLAP